MARQFSGVPGCTAVRSPRARTRSAMSSRIAIVCGPVRFLASTRRDAPSITLAANSTPARNDGTSIGLESSISDMDRLRGSGDRRIGRGDEGVLDRAAHGFLVTQNAAREQPVVAERNSDDEIESRGGRHAVTFSERAKLHLMIARDRDQAPNGGLRPGDREAAQFGEPAHDARLAADRGGDLDIA